MIRERMGWRAAPILASALAACASPPEEMPHPEEDSVPQELVTSLEVKVGGDSVQLRLHATNVTERPVVLEFTSGQRFDFAIQQEGREIWRWSTGRAFTQALGSESISPGATLTYSAAWEPEERTGNFRAVGMITARERAVRQEATFSLPAEES